MEGWICPRCQRVWAPWVKECTCKPIFISRYNCSSAEDLKEAFKKLDAQEVSSKISEAIEKIYKELSEKGTPE